MSSGARLFGHPLHPVFVVFPLGLLTTAVLFDILHTVTHNPAWSQAAFYMIAAGIIGGLVAALFGLIDWMAIPPGTRARQLGRVHGLGNVLVVALFAASWWLRLPDPTGPTGLALALSFAGVLLAAVTGWLGGELVFRLGVGVDRAQ